MDSLAHITLLNTRPRHQAEALNQLVRKQGGQALSCPTLQIEWLPISPQAMQGLAQSSIWVVTSPNAWLGLQKRALQFPPDLSFNVQTLYPIGQATRRIVMQKGEPYCSEANRVLENKLKNARIPSPAKESQDSEALVEQILVTEPAHQNVAILKGQGGRQFLAEQLQAKKFHVELVETYRRTPAPFCQQVWQQFRQATHPVLLASSVESWHNLKQAVIQQAGEVDWQWAQQQPCIVFSQRIAQSLTEAGWQGEIWVSAPGDQNIVKTLQAHL